MNMQTYLEKKVDLNRFHANLIYEGVYRTNKADVFFVPIPKCANTLIKKLLIEISNPEVLKLDFDSYKVNEYFSRQDWIHTLAFESIRVPLHNLSTDAKIITFCRNPYSRLISAYKNKIVSPQMSEIEYARWLKREALFDAMRKNTYDANDFPPEAGVSFSKFVRFVIENESFKSDIHWVSQLSLNAANLIPNCKVVKLENLSEELPIIFSEDLGLTISVDEILNKTDEYDCKFDQSTADFIYSYFKDDFTFFQYDKNSWKDYT